MDEFSGLYNFLVLQQTHRDIFSKKWEEFERWSTKSTGEVAQDQQSAAASGEQSAASGDQSAASGGQSSASGGKAGASGGGVKPAASEANKKRAKSFVEHTEDSDHLKQALRVKAQYIKHVGAAAALIERIKSGESYTWANNSQNVGTLEACLMKLKDTMTSFDKQFIIEDPKTMLAQVGQSKWQGLLETFNNRQAFIGELSSLTQQIILMNSMIKS
jgi:hypothetical protein